MPKNRIDRDDDDKGPPSLIKEAEKNDTQNFVDNKDTEESKKLDQDIKAELQEKMEMIEFINKVYDRRYLNQSNLNRGIKIKLPVYNLTLPLANIEKKIEHINIINGYLKKIQLLYAVTTSTDKIMNIGSALITAIYLFIKNFGDKSTFIDKDIVSIIKDISYININKNKKQIDISKKYKVELYTYQITEDLIRKNEELKDQLQTFTSISIKKWFNTSLQSSINYEYFKSMRLRDLSEEDEFFLKKKIFDDLIDEFYRKTQSDNRLLKISEVSVDGYPYDIVELIYTHPIIEMRNIIMKPNNQVVNLFIEPNTSGAEAATTTTTTSVASGFNNDEYIGSGFINLRRNDYPPLVRKYIKILGDNKIRSIKACRRPIWTTINYVLDFMSLGSWSKKKKENNYDYMFHTFLIVKFDNSEREYLIEKNQVVYMKEYKLDLNDRFVNVKVNHNVNFREFMYKPIGVYGQEILEYDPVYANCQKFVQKILHCSGLLSQEVVNFINQDVEKVLISYPYYISKVASMAANRLDTIIHGRGLITKK
jgi:hypothetical protein